jgi:pyruvate/2-oxoglutarate dehydrogenase complex dihydrolipoamide acyltransferase (E2) component
MLQDFTMPKSGHLMEQGTVVLWRKKAGETVAKGDILCDIEADKGVFEAESPFSGRLVEITVPEKQTVDVGVTLAKIEVTE